MLDGYAEGCHQEAHADALAVHECFEAGSGGDAGVRGAAEAVVEDQG